MIFNYLKIFRQITLFNQSTNSSLTRAFSKMTTNDYMPVLKYWFGVDDLAKIKEDKYAGNNLVSLLNFLKTKFEYFKTNSIKVSFSF